MGSCILHPIHVQICLTDFHLGGISYRWWPDELTDAVPSATIAVWLILLT